MGSIRLTRYINAPRHEVYATLLDREALPRWKVPDGMTGVVHTFEPREDGAIRVSLTYDVPDAQGKSSDHTDTYHGRFTKLVPNALVVEVDEFESEMPELQGEMTITITLEDAGAGTLLSATHDGLPSGVSEKDNETGWNMALDKLTALCESASTKIRRQSVRDGAIVNNPLLDVLVDSWDRNNRILVNLLRAIQEEQLLARSNATSPTVGAMFAHMHFVRLIFVEEDAPEFATPLPPGEWLTDLSKGELVTMLDSSSRTVHQAVVSRINAARAMDMHYDHPLLFLQHMIWHEGYHHGQIKLTLKLAGFPVDDSELGPLTWGVWMKQS